MAVRLAALRLLPEGLAGLPASLATLPIFRPRRWGCSSAWLECRTVTAEVAGSSPVSPAPACRTPSRRTGCCVSPLEECRGMAEPAPTLISPVLLGPVLAAAAGVRSGRWTRHSATAATPRRSGRPGAEVLGIDRDPDAIATARARLGDAGIRYLNAGLRSTPRRWPRPRASSPTSCSSTWGSPPANWTRWSGVLLSDRARRWTCGWAAGAPPRQTC